MSEQLNSDQYFAFQNAASIMEIPEEQILDMRITERLADEELLHELVKLALAGADVYAYTPIGSDQYNLWVRQPYAYMESRFKPDEFAAKWRAGKMPEYRAGGDGRD
jgi:hypothetical protein